MSIPEFGNSNGTPFAQEIKIVKNFKKALLMVAGAAVQKFKDKLAHQQEILMNIADMIIEVYMLESALLKTEKLVYKSLSKSIYFNKKIRLQLSVYKNKLN